MTESRQHRVFLVPGLPDHTAEAVHRHWVRQHLEAFVATPHLVAYVQNRPLPEERSRVGSMVCSETWFADREAERTAFASTHYRDVVAPDEARFLAREEAWGARITASDPWPSPTPRYRVLGFGSSTLAHDEQVVSVDRDVAVPGGGRALRSWWTDDRDEALRRARGAVGLAIACEPWSWRSGDGSVG